MGKIRMADIAAKVGVSTVTVHNAIAGRKGVSDEMREKILKVAQELGYTQNTAAARRERARDLRRIGVIISEKYLAEYITFYWKMYQELALIAAEKSCMVAVEILKHEAEDNLIMPKTVAEDTVDGLIVVGEINKEYISLMKSEMQFPIVFLDFYDKNLACDAVISDNFYGMYMLTEYLFDRGFKKLAYVGSIHATSSIMDRFCGFYKAMLEHGEKIPDEWVIEDRNPIGDIVFELPRVMPEAFVCNCDLTAGKLIMKLEKAGYQVPGDVSVIGFDNYLYPGFPDKKITTYEVDTKAMARAALEKVLKQVKNSSMGRGLTIVAGHIVEKETVGGR